MAMGYYFSRFFAICVIGVCVVSFGCRTLLATEQCGLEKKQAKLDKLLKKIDHDLVFKVIQNSSPQFRDLLPHLHGPSCQLLRGDDLLAGEIPLGKDSVGDGPKLKHLHLPGTAGPDLGRHSKHK